MRVTIREVPGPYASHCWVTNRKPRKDGYVDINRGEERFNAGGRRHLASVQAHRLALVHAGFLPTDELYSPNRKLNQGHHGCFRRACVRPRHLHIVTARENIARSNARSANGVRTGLCPQGHLLSANAYRHSGSGVGCNRCRLDRSRRKNAEDRAIYQSLDMTQEQWNDSTPAYRATMRAEHRAKQSA